MLQKPHDPATKQSDLITKKTRLFERKIGKKGKGIEREILREEQDEEDGSCDCVYVSIRKRDDRGWVFDLEIVKKTEKGGSGLCV